MDSELDKFEDSDDVVMDPVDEETSFISQPSVTPNLTTADPITAANDILNKNNLPDLSTIITEKMGGNADQRELAKIINNVKPRDDAELGEVVQEYEDVMSVKQAPSVPSNTPGVDPIDQGRIDNILSLINVKSVIDHGNFIPLEDGGLSVKTSKGSRQITQKNPKMFLVEPKIPTNEYEKLFGFDKKEYDARVRARNTVVKDYIQARTIEVARLKTNIEFSNPAFEDPDAPLLPVPADEAPSWQKRKLVDKLKSSLTSTTTSITTTTRELLGKLKPNKYQPLPTEEIEMGTLEPEQREKTVQDLEQMYGKLQGLGPQFAPIIDEMNEIAREYNESEDAEQRGQQETRFANKKAELDSKLDELDSLRKKKNTILKVVGGGLVATGIGIGGVLAGIFEAVANALGSDTAKNLIPKSTDPKDIAESGIGKIILKKLDDLWNYFHDQYLNSVGTMKDFWHMMENAVDFLRDHLWLIIAGALALIAYEINKD
jgi:hypothetical protein